MSTMVADLLPRIERSHLWFSENVELLFCAQIASSCHRVEGGPPVDHLPFNVEGVAPGLEFPDVGAQFGLALLVWVGKGALVARISTLPRGSRDPDVGLHLLLAVHRGLNHRGLVHVVGGDAFSLEWALASQPRRPWAVAAPLLLLRNSCGQHLLVVLGHHLLDVGAGSIADLQGLAVEDLQVCRICRIYRICKICKICKNCKI